jgi:hypothetical protein
MAIDGTIEEVPDSAANSKRFGRSENQHSASAYPQIRCVDLIECGTHAIVAARIRSYRSNAHGMARNLLGHLTRRC